MNSFHLLLTGEITREITEYLSVRYLSQITLIMLYCIIKLGNTIRKTDKQKKNTNQIK